MKTSTPEEITEHLRDLRHRLACHRWSLQRMDRSIQELVQWSFKTLDRTATCSGS